MNVMQRFSLNPLCWRVIPWTMLYSLAMPSIPLYMKYINVEEEMAYS